MKKILATVLMYVLGGVIGSNIYAADIPKPKSYITEEKKVAVVDREAAFQSAISQFYDDLKAEMSRQPAKKQDAVKKLTYSPHEPEQTGRMVWGLLNEQVKNDESKVAASVNAHVGLNNGKLENMVVSGQAGLAGIALNYDIKTGNSTTNLSLNKEGSRVDVTLRDCKDPLIRLAVPLKFIKGVNFAGVFDSKIDYTSASIGMNHEGVNASVCYELISDHARTTMRVGYSPKSRFPIRGSFTRVTYLGQESYSFDSQSKIGPVDVLVSARNNGNGRYMLAAQASAKISF